MSRTTIFLVFAVAIFLVWYTPKIRAAQRLNFRPLLPNSFGLRQGAISWTQPIAVTNALNASISIQNADFRIKGEDGSEYAQAILPAPVLVGGNATTAMPLLVQIPALQFPAIVQAISKQVKYDGNVSLVFDGVIKAEWFWFNIQPFKLDVPLNFFKSA